MKKLTLLYSISVLVLISCSPTEPKNDPPIITEIITNPSEPKAGETVILNAIATDKDNDILTYNWSATGGSFSSSGIGNPIYWYGPNAESDFDITCIVSDGKDTDSKIITLSLYFDYGRIFGYVYEESTTNPIGMVNIYIMDQHEFSASMTGYYEFRSGVEIGEQRIWAIQSGYITYSDTIYVNGGDNPLDIYLKKQ